MNNVFKVPDSLAEKYHGSGLALAASANGGLVDIVYLSDIVGDFDPDELAMVVEDERLGPNVRYLQSLGSVHVGMLSNWEFVEL